jgi:hypothetical protein
MEYNISFRTKRKWYGDTTPSWGSWEYGGKASTKKEALEIARDLRSTGGFTHKDLQTRIRRSMGNPSRAHSVRLKGFSGTITRTNRGQVLIKGKGRRG